MWSCEYCENEYQTEKEAEIHEKKCSKNPAKILKKKPKLKEKKREKTCIVCEKLLDDALWFDEAGALNFNFYCPDCKAKQVEEDYFIEAEFQREALKKGLTQGEAEYYDLRKKIRKKRFKEYINNYVKVK